MAGGLAWKGLSEVRLDGAAIAQLLRGPQGPVVRNLIVTGEKVRQRAKVYVGKDTRQLERSIVKRLIREGGKPAMLVGSEQDYAEIHHEGRGEVRPVRAKVLRFVVKGRVVYAMKVKAVKGNPFLTRALREIIGRGR